MACSSGPSSRQYLDSSGLWYEHGLADAEPVGLGVAGVRGDLRDGLGGQLEIIVEVLNNAMSCSVLR